MTFSIQKRKIYRVTLKEVMNRLQLIKGVEVENLKQSIIDCFEDYDYEDIEELAGYENWQDYSNDGQYQLSIKIDHEDAYEFSLSIDVKNSKASVIKVL